MLNKESRAKATIRIDCSSPGFILAAACLVKGYHQTANKSEVCEAVKATDKNSVRTVQGRHFHINSSRFRSSCFDNGMDGCYRKFCSNRGIGLWLGSIEALVEKRAAKRIR